MIHFPIGMDDERSQGKMSASISHNDLTKSGEDRRRGQSELSRAAAAATAFIIGISRRNRFTTDRGQKGIFEAKAGAAAEPLDRQISQISGFTATD